MAQEIERISPDDARRDVEVGHALLVCAYADDTKCQAIRLEHATTLNVLQQRLANLPKDHEIIFYCA